MPIAFAAVAVLAIANAEAPQEPAPATRPAQPPPAAIPPTLPSIRAVLQPPASVEHGLRWSPKGATVPLQRDGAELKGAFALGHAGAREVMVRLTRSDGAAHFDVLSLDCDRDGNFADGERLHAVPKEQRGKWWSSFSAEIAVPLADGSGTRGYPLNLWFVEDPQEPDAPPALRWSRRGWCEGEVEIGGARAFVLITEMHMDGVFDQRDAWAIARDHDALMRASSRSLEQHVWLDGAAYRATAIDGDGRSIEFAAFDPGFTEAEEKAKADTTAPDRAAPRAAAPLQFGKDLDAALALAAQQKKRVFVDFQTTWCGPCRQMEQWVYSAKDVVDAAANMIPVVLDGDEQRALVKRFGVAAYPTMLLLSPDGEVVARAVGYRGVAAMTRFLRDGVDR